MWHFHLRELVLILDYSGASNFLLNLLFSCLLLLMIASGYFAPSMRLATLLVEGELLLHVNTHRVQVVGLTLPALEHV